MENKGSNSLVASSGGSSDSSLNGLKFGKKIYFEDVGIGVSAKSDGGSSSISVSKGSNSKKGRGLVQGGKPPRCQVQGCKVDLSGAKSYYSKHKVCGMHSKSPMVIVAGLEQRFCQQCSRFHQLPEFDQGKRSCRRRLAGHNERRRKPPSESLLSSRYGRLAASLQENSSRVGSFVMDFTTYPRVPSRDIWPIGRAGDRIPDNQPTATGKFLPHIWQGSSENPPANVFSHTSHQYLQDSAGVTVFSSSEIPSSECFAGVSDSSCALSLLSNQPWSPRNRNPYLTVNNLMGNEGNPMAQITAPHYASANNFTLDAWSFKGNEASTSSHEMPRNLGLVHAPQPIDLSGQLELALQGNRAYGSSTHQMQWPL